MILLFDPEQKEVRASTHCEIEGLCFFVSIRCMHTGQENRAAVVSCAYELRHYLEVAKDVEIHRVQMACPPSITGQCQWTLSELESVIIYSGVDTDESAVVYRTKSGVLKLGDLDLRKRKKSRILYSNHALANRIAEASERRSSITELSLYSALWAS